MYLTWQVTKALDFLKNYLYLHQMFFRSVCVQGKPLQAATKQESKEENQKGKLEENLILGSSIN